MIRTLFACCLGLAVTAVAFNAAAESMNHGTEARVVTRDHDPVVRYPVRLQVNHGPHHLQKAYLYVDSHRYHAKQMTRDSAPRRDDYRDRVVPVRILNSNVYIHPRVRYDINPSGNMDDQIYLERARALYLSVQGNRAHVVRGSELPYTLPAETDQEVAADEGDMVKVEPPKFDKQQAESTEAVKEDATPEDKDDETEMYVSAK